jgi:hypothetical protein
MRSKARVLALIGVLLEKRRNVIVTVMEAQGRSEPLVLAETAQL